MALFIQNVQIFSASFQFSLISCSLHITVFWYNIFFYLCSLTMLHILQDALVKFQPWDRLIQQIFLDSLPFHNSEAMRALSHPFIILQPEMSFAGAACF
uniref:Uncharacterized protein n=1 Tax=Anguilla anguilla TaxID=7936 RepID=A0A0E9WS86_ANGAN